jgi:hypothetical protein
VESVDQGPATLPAPFVISALPEITALGGAARRRQDPLPVQLPVVANGVLDANRAADDFSFRVDSPQTVLLQLDSMQLGSMLDPMVALSQDQAGDAEVVHFFHQSAVQIVLPIRPATRRCSTPWRTISQATATICGV